MIDFEFSFRWFRLFYILTLAAFVFFTADSFPESPWIPALICLAGIIDISIDKEVYNMDNSELELDDEEQTDKRGYGPGS